MITTTFLRVTLLALSLAATTTIALPTTTVELSSTINTTTTSNLTSPTNFTRHGPILLPRKEHWECMDYSSLHDDSSDASPQWGHCQTMLHKVRTTDGGHGWNFPNHNGLDTSHREIASYLSCAFGVKVLGGQHPLGTNAKVGDRDMEEVFKLIKKVYNKNRKRKEDSEIGEAEKVGFGGKMRCYLLSPLKELWDVEWGVYKYCAKSPAGHC